LEDSKDSISNINRGNCSAGKHDGANDNAQPDGTTDDATACDADEPDRTHDTAAADANNAAATYDDAAGTNAANNAATAAGRAT
jgi:hypothetical protein